MLALRIHCFNNMFNNFLRSVASSKPIIFKHNKRLTHTHSSNTTRNIFTSDPSTILKFNNDSMYIEPNIIHEVPELYSYTGPLGIHDNELENLYNIMFKCANYKILGLNDASLDNDLIFVDLEIKKIMSSKRNSWRDNVSAKFKNVCRDFLCDRHPLSKALLKN